MEGGQGESTLNSIPQNSQIRNISDIQNLKELVTSCPAVHETFKKVTQVERKPHGNLDTQKETECQKWEIHE